MSFYGFYVKGNSVGGQHAIRDNVRVSYRITCETNWLAGKGVVYEGETARKAHS